MKFRFDLYEGRPRIRTAIPAGQEARTFAADELFQFGIEEEYFLSDARTLQAPSETPESLFRTADFGTVGHVGREFLQAQIEVATEPNCSFDNARIELMRLRQNAAAAAADHGLAILACG